MKKQLKALALILAILTSTACGSKEANTTENINLAQEETENEVALANIKTPKANNVAVEEENTENKENKDAKDTKDEKKDSKEDKEAKKDTDKETSDKDDGMEDVDEEELREELKNLEDSLFENKVQARASEILIEEHPELVADIRDELDSLLEESNASVEASEELIRQVKEYLGEE